MESKLAHFLKLRPSKSKTARNESRQLESSILTSDELLALELQQQEASETLHTDEEIARILQEDINISKASLNSHARPGNHGPSALSHTSLDETLAWELHQQEFGGSTTSMNPGFVDGLFVAPQGHVPTPNVNGAVATRPSASPSSASSNSSNPVHMVVRGPRQGASSSDEAGSSSNHRGSTSQDGADRSASNKLRWAHWLPRLQLPSSLTGHSASSSAARSSASPSLSSSDHRASRSATHRPSPTNSSPPAPRAGEESSSDEGNLPRFSPPNRQGRHLPQTQLARDVESMRYEDLVSLVETLGNVECGLDNDAIASLPVRKYRASQQSKTDGPDACVICQSEYKARDEVKTLPCLHGFHSPCIDTWLHKSHTCPICQMDLRVLDQRA